MRQDLIKQSISTVASFLSFLFVDLYFFPNISSSALKNHTSHIFPFYWVRVVNNYLNTVDRFENLMLMHFANAPPAKGIL